VPAFLASLFSKNLFIDRKAFNRRRMNAAVVRAFHKKIPVFRPGTF